MSDDLIERAAAFLDGLGITGAQKRGAALALTDLIRSVVREEMAAARREAFEHFKDEGNADA